MEKIKLHEELSRRFAPQVRLHSRELYFPAEVNWYLQRCQCQIRTGLNDKDPILLPRPVDPKALANLQHCLNGRFFYSKGISKIMSPFYLRIVEPNTVYGRPQELDQCPVYTHVYQNNEYEIDIQYFFFYAYNGPLLSYLPSAGIHEGDWEHITFRLKVPSSDVENPEKYTLLALHTARHAKEGRWYLLDGSKRYSDTLKFTEDGHPIIYSSKFGHTSYVSCGRQKRFVPFGMIDDYTDDQGKWWSTWKNIQHIGKIEDEDFMEKTNTWWLLFNGLWGPYGYRLAEGDGPTGPAMKEGYSREDPITITNS